MTHNLFIKTKLDKPYELELEGTIGKLASVLDIRKSKLSCFSCCAGQQAKPEPKDEPDVVKKKLPLSADSVVPSKATSSRLILKAPGYASLISTKSQYRIPLFLNDVQRFLLLPLLSPSKYDYFTTKWIDIVKRDEITKTVLIVIDGATMNHYKDYQNVFLNLKHCFQSSFEVVTNTVNNGSVVEELCVLPLISVFHEQLVKIHSCIDSVFNVVNDKTAMLSTVFPISQTQQNPATPLNTKDVFPRQRLILTASDMVDEDFPIPIPGKLKNKCMGYTMTKEKYFPVSDVSPLFSLCCERCNQDDTKSGLYRITLIDEKYNVIYDSYVLPYNKIFSKSSSELTRQMLLDMKTRIAEAHDEISKAITPNSILVGDSLQDDLHSLKLMHPYVINTSTIFNFTGSKRWKSKLKDISMHYLDRQIDVSKKENTSPDYALVAMELVQLKLAHTIQFGDKVLIRQRDKHILYDTNARMMQAQVSGREPDAEKQQMATESAVLGSEAIIKKYMETAPKKMMDKIEHTKSIKAIPCSTNKMVVSNTKKVLNDHDYLIAHLNYTAADAFDTNSVLQLDRWVKALWTACPEDTLVSVLLTGNKDHTGAYFVNIKE